MVAQHDKAQRLIRTLGDGQESPHAQFFNLGFVQHFAGKHFFLLATIGLAHDFFGRFSQFGGRGVIAGAVGPFARQIHARHHGLRLLKRSAAFRPVGHTDHNLAQLGLGAGFGVAIYIARHGNRLHGDHQLLGICGLRKADRQSDHVAPVRAHGFVQHVAQLTGRACTHAQHDDLGRCPACGLIQRQGFAFFCREMTCFDSLCHYRLHASLCGFFSLACCGCFG